MTADHPYVLIMQWQPTPAWAALSRSAQQVYLASLDARIAAGRTLGMQTLGWSQVNQSVTQSTYFPFAGVFGFKTEADRNAMLADVAQSQWYDFFETQNTALYLQGADTAEPSLVYAQLLGLVHANLSP